MGLKLNVGSGQHPYRGFTNIDIQPRWNPDVVADGANMPMFEDNSAELIVCEHTLEHYGCGEANAMLKECWRILQPGGSLVVTVPDIYELVRAWLDGRLTDQVFMTNIYGAYNGDEADRHKWGMTTKTLIETLRSAAPWSSVKPHDWEKLSEDGPSRDWWITGARAIK